MSADRISRNQHLELEYDKNRRIPIRSAFPVWLCILATWASIMLIEGASANSKTVTADASLESWSVSRWLAGTDYRDLWKTPIDVELLNLQSFAGGLTPNFRVGGQQTIGLAMTGNDGKSYTFRGVVKDLSSTLPKDFREYWIDDIVQDQLAAAHPAGPLIVPKPRVYCIRRPNWY